MTYPVALKNSLVPRIMVIGDAILDSYIVGDINRVNPEAPVPLLNVTSTYTKLGGAGNVVANLSALGAEVYFVGTVGDDDNGDLLVEMINQQVKSSYVMRDRDKITPMKTRLISGEQQLFRYDNETTHEHPHHGVLRSAKEMIELVNPHIVIFSDYGKGTLDITSTQGVINLCNEKEILTYVDPHIDNLAYYENCHCLKLNMKQARAIAKRTMIRFADYEDEKFLKLFCDLVKMNYNIDDVIVTRAEEGFYAKIGKEYYSMPSVAVDKIIDVTGAGDTVISALTFALSKGATIRQSLETARIAAAIAIQEVGTYQVTLDELLSAYEIIHHPTNYQYLDLTSRSSKLVTKEELINNLCGRKFVLVNGCFDVLHPGHIELIRFAKSQGNILVVAINSDESIKRLKGPSRPIIKQEDRIKQLSEFMSVDYIVVFDEDTPVPLIKEIKPFLHVKGSDHEGEKDIENTVFFKRIEGYSTTKITKS